MHAMIFKNVAVLFVLTMFVGFGTSVSAQTAGELTVTTSDNEATVTFERSTPCTPYVLSWGDGEQTEFTSEDDICAQVIDQVSLAHTYDEPGTYTVTLEMSNETWSKVVVVTEETEQALEQELFGLYQRLLNLLQEVVNRMERQIQG